MATETQQPDSPLPEESLSLTQGLRAETESNVRARHGLGLSAFPSIADYGFLSDCEVTALVASSGNVE
ncbi:MAG: hypothetical protein ACJ72W_14040 [Actinoallomurus sp.]